MIHERTYNEIFKRYLDKYNITLHKKFSKKFWSLYFGCHFEDMQLYMWITFNKHPKRILVQFVHKRCNDKYIFIWPYSVSEFLTLMEGYGYGDNDEQEAIVELMNAIIDSYQVDIKNFK